MSLAIIIVSWNTRELTLRCLKSIFKSIKNIDFKVYLIDNNSTDGTIEAIQKLFGLKTGVITNNVYVTPSFSSDRLEIIANQENVGFAKANNQAINLCHPRESEDPGVNWQTQDPRFRGDDNLFLLLNPDTELIDDSLIKMIEFAKTNPDIGIVGPKLLNSDLTLQRSCRQFPKLLDQLLIQLKFYNFWPEKFKAIRQYFMLDFGHHEKREVDQVMGAAMLIKKEVFDKIGLLDEKFWAIFEEVDFCKRAKDAGFQTFFYPEWQIVHHKEQSFGQWKKLRKQINFNRSLYYYFKKHQPFWQLFILWLAQPINLFLTLLDSLVGVRKKAGKSKDL